MLPGNSGAGGAGGGPTASAAAFARKRLQAAMAQGLLPQNLQLAHTRQNLLGQFHMLNPGLVNARHNGGATPDNQSNIMSLIAKLGANNLVARGQQPNYSPGFNLPNQGREQLGGPPGVNVGDPGYNGGSPFDQAPAGGGGMQGALMQMLLQQLFGGGGGGFDMAQPYFNPSMPTLY